MKSIIKDYASPFIIFSFLVVFTIIILKLLLPSIKLSIPFLNSGLSNITQAVVLFWTGVALVIYTYETKKLREESHRQVEVGYKQIRVTQEQLELQLLPFVVLMREDDKYFFWNAGNGTAVNVKVSVAIGHPEDYEIFDYTTRTAILTKDKKDIVRDTNPTVLENKNFHIEFENINKKSYFVSGRLENGKTEILDFGRYEPL